MTTAPFLLVLLVAGHAALIVMPMAAAVLAGLRAGTREVAVLAMHGLVFGGFAAFVLFWIWRFNATAGALASIAFVAASAAALAWLVVRTPRETLRVTRPLAVAALVWGCHALFILAFGLAPLGFQSPLGAVQHHFGLALPYDNVLPWIFATQVTEGRVAIPMTGDWLSSDRPPLQTAYFLASLASLLPRSELHYQVQSTLLQALWVPGMWLLLRAFDLARGAVFLALMAGMFSGFGLIHGLFTWPKLFPVAYLAVATAVLLEMPAGVDDRRVAVGVGGCIALAGLSHAGSLLVLPGLAVALALMRRLPPARFVMIAGLAALAIMLPWGLYQKLVDPPGNRLAKWHLAGVVPIDSRSTVEAIRDSYAALTLPQLIESKRQSLGQIVGPADGWILIARASTTGVDDREASRLRRLQFRHIVTALGVLALAPLAWLAPAAWRTREFRASLQLSAACAFTIVPWLLLMFQPGGTTIHTGSFAVVCFLFAGAMLAFFAASRWLAIAALALHLLLTYQVYARGAPLAAGASAADYRAFAGLAVVALALTGFGCWKLSAMRNPEPRPWRAPGGDSIG